MSEPAEQKIERYGSYRARCAELERRLAALRAGIPADQHDATIEYLLESANAFIKAAEMLAEIRLRGAKGDRRDEH